MAHRSDGADGGVGTSACLDDEACYLVSGDMGLGPRGVTEVTGGDHLCHRRCDLDLCSASELCEKVGQHFSDTGEEREALCFQPEPGALRVPRPNADTVVVESDHRVRVIDSRARVFLDTSCSAPGFRVGSEFLTRVQALVAANDFKTLSTLMRYPLSDGATVIRDEAAFRAFASARVTPAFKAALAAADPLEVACGPDNFNLQSLVQLWAENNRLWVVTLGGLTWTRENRRKRRR